MLTFVFGSFIILAYFGNLKQNIESERRQRMNVLIACEESQAVCKEFRKLGHRAFSCDLQECSGGHPEWHVQGDCLPLLNGRCTFTTMDGHTHTQADRWDLIIAHPPCTYLSSVATRHLYAGGVINEDRYKKGVEAAAFFMKCLEADCDKICIENPVQFKLFNLPQYTQIIHPYQFGDPFDKRTCLWLKGLPELAPTEVLTEYNNCSQNKGEMGKSWFTQGGKDRQRNRSKTFPGIARAMAEQWGNGIRPQYSINKKGQYEFT